MADNEILKWTFTQAANEYDAIRPGYPAALINDVVGLSHIPQSGKILEVGCGTGQATLPFARRGYTMVCLDIGAEMLAVAAEKLREFPNVRFVQTAFEDWPAAPGSYDLIISATAFHWVPRDVGYPLAARMLTAQGALAVFSNEHPRPLTGFAAEAQPIYQRFGPHHKDFNSLPSTELDIQARAAYMRLSGLFQQVYVRTYPWTATYTTQDYLSLLNTYSDHRAMPADQRQALFAALADLIETRYEGKIEKQYLAVLYLGKKGG